jgi:ABC-type multidrug transport system fused ATPase/permease subunit
MTKSISAPGYIQLFGSLKRITIEKRRNCCATFCEFTSHFIILLILVLGYYRSKVFDFSADSYSTLSVQIPPPIIVNPSSESAYGLYSSFMNGPLIVPNLDQYVTFGRLLQPYRYIYRSAIMQTTFGRSFQNLFFQGDLHFAPSSAATKSLINYMNTTYTTFKTLNVIVHTSEDDAIDYIMKNLESSSFALIVIRQATLQKVNYVIRQNYTTLPNTNRIMEIPAMGLQTTYQQYFLSGFLTLQKAVDQWAFQYTNATQSTETICTAGPPNAVIMPYPTFAYNQNPFYSSVGFLLGLAIVMSTMYPMSKLTKSIVEEKETKMRELMKIMGLKDWVHGCSWFLSAFVLFLFIAITMTLITTATFIKTSNKLIIFIYFFCFCLSEITFSFLVSVFFSNSKLAAIAAPVVLFSTILPRYLFYTTNENENVIYKVLACFLSPTAFTFAADTIALYEYGGIGIQPGNMFDGKFNFATCVLMMFLDFFIYGFLAWYLDKVLPHEYGTSYHPFFIFEPKYWCGDSLRWIQNVFRRGRQARNGDDEDEMNFIDFEDMPEFYEAASVAEEGAEQKRNGDQVDHEDKEKMDRGVNTDYDEEKGVDVPARKTNLNGDIESIQRDLRSLTKIRIKDLGKTYADGKIAVQHLSLSLIEGQITCLLGHNGAGKIVLCHCISSLFLTNVLSLG